MITRDIHQQLVVPAFTHASRFGGCGAGTLNFTCSTAGAIAAAGATGMGSCALYFPGMVIDRWGLRQSYRSIMIAPNVYGDMNVSDENTKIHFKGISVGLQHTCTTGGTWADYSTGDWLIYQGLWRQTTATSTAQGFYTAVQRDAADVLGGNVTTATSTSAGHVGSTSTSIAYYVGPAAKFDLGGAKRYLRCLIRPHFETTACADLGLEVSAVAIFGEADASPPPDTQVSRILVTTPCAT